MAPLGGSVLGLDCSLFPAGPCCPLPSAHLEQEQLAPWLSPRLGETVHRCLLHNTLWHGTLCGSPDCAGLQQEWSTGEGESGVSKNAFGQQGWAGGSKEMMEKCTDRTLFCFSHSNSSL